VLAIEQRPFSKPGVTAQEAFDRHYVSSAEIVQRLGITRATVLKARRDGRLPDPIRINGSQLFIWERSTVEPYLDKWEKLIRARRELAEL